MTKTTKWIQVLVVASLLAVGLVSCSKRTMSKEDARTSMQEISAFLPALEVAGEGSPVEALKAVEGLVATAPLSKLAKEQMVATMRIEVEIADRLMKIFGPLRDEEGFLDDARMQAALQASEGWEEFARRKVSAERGLYRKYIDEACELLPPSGVAGARDALDKNLPLYDDYERILAEDGTNVVRAAVALYSFVIANKASMRGSGGAVLWNSDEKDAEFGRLMDDLDAAAAGFEANLDKLLQRRSERMKAAEEAIQSALSKLVD